jgi:hypothetical protein
MHSNLNEIISGSLADKISELGARKLAEEAWGSWRPLGTVLKSLCQMVEGVIIQVLYYDLYMLKEESSRGEFYEYVLNAFKFD